MAKDGRFTPLRPVGERKPDSRIDWTFKDPEKQREREAKIDSQPSFMAKPRLAPKKCPVCQTDAVQYRNEHNGQELLLQGGNPYVCAECGNTEWNI